MDVGYHSQHMCLCFVYLCWACALLIYSLFLACSLSRSLDLSFLCCWDLKSQHFGLCRVRGVWRAGYCRLGGTVKDGVCGRWYLPLVLQAVYLCIWMCFGLCFCVFFFGCRSVRVDVGACVLCVCVCVYLQFTVFSEHRRTHQSGLKFSV